MNFYRLRELLDFDHLMTVEVEADDYGYRQWVPSDESDLDRTIAEYARLGYSLSDIDHHSGCPCLASWDEWLFLLDFQRLSA